MHALGRRYMLRQAKTGRNLLAIRSVQLAVNVCYLHRYSSEKYLLKLLLKYLVQMHLEIPVSTCKNAEIITILILLYRC